MPDAAALASPLPARLYVRDVVQGMVPMVLVRVLADHLLARGVEPQRLIPAQLSLAEPLEGARLPGEAYCQLLMRVAEHLHDPLLGLHLGQAIQARHLGHLGYALQACGTLADALAHIERYHRLVHDINPLSHAVSGGHLTLRWGVSHGRPGALFDEAGVTSIVQFARALCQTPLALVAVDFVNPPPPDPHPYTRFFGCPVRFAQAETRLVIPLGALGTPLKQPDVHLRQLMDAQVDAALARLPEAGGPDGLADLTRSVIRHMAPHGLPELEAVAQALRLSPRVFYRRLAQQGLNFRDLRATALHALAETHLRDPGLSLAEVSARLGYAEQSTFSRAFRRWAGQSPRQWRRQHT